MAIVKTNKLSPKENKRAPKPAIIIRNICTSLGPNLSSKIPRGTWKKAKVNRYAEVSIPSSCAFMSISIIRFGAMTALVERNK